MPRYLSMAGVGMMMAGAGSLAVPALAQAPAQAGSAESAQPSPASPADYVARASASDLYEIDAARLAAQKSKRAEVRSLAAMIEKDHRLSTERLTRAAKDMRPALALAPRMTAKQQADLAALRKADGSAFDREYLRQQVAAHQEALSLVEPYAKDGSAPALRAHAASVAGPIRHHLERARELSQQR